MKLLWMISASVWLISWFIAIYQGDTDYKIMSMVGFFGSQILANLAE